MGRTFVLRTWQLLSSDMEMFPTIISRGFPGGTSGKEPTRRERQGVAPSGFWKLPFRGILRSQDPVSSKLSLCLAHIFIMCLCSSRIKCNTIIKHPADCGGTQGWTKRPRAGNGQLGPQSRECDMCYQLMKEWGVPLRERETVGGGVLKSA